MKLFNNKKIVKSHNLKAQFDNRRQPRNIQLFLKEPGLSLIRNNLFSPYKVAKYLGVCIRIVYRWIAKRTEKPQFHLNQNKLSLKKLSKGQCEHIKTWVLND